MDRCGASVVALAAALSLLAQPAAAQVTAIGEPEGAVSIVAWPGYIERGETDASSTG